MRQHVIHPNVLRNALALMRETSDVHAALGFGQLGMFAGPVRRSRSVPFAFPSIPLCHIATDDHARHSCFLPKQSTGSLHPCRAHTAFFYRRLPPLETS